MRLNFCNNYFGQVPLYIGAQLSGSLLASLTLRLMFNVTPEAFFGTTPADSVARALVAEIIISFLLMFVISGVATDSRAVSVFYICHHCFIPYLLLVIHIGSSYELQWAHIISSEQWWNQKIFLLGS